MKINNKKLFLGNLIITVIWTIVIFSFSMQSGDDSHELSGGIVAGFVAYVFRDNQTS